MARILIILILVLVAVYAYLFFYVRRIFATLGAPVKKKLFVLLCALVTLGLTLLSINVSLGLIFVVHLAVLAAVWQLVNFIVKLIARKKYNDGFRLWRFIYGIGVLPILCTVAVLIIGHINLNTVVKTEYTIYTDKEIRGEGYRVAMIADVHFGISLDYTELTEKCTEISAEKPDIVVLCGDIVDNSTTRQELEQVFKALGKIENKLGIYYVYGNHDRSMSALSNEFSDEELLETIEKNGITVLRDETIQLTDDLVLVGREDESRKQYKEGRKSISELLSSLDHSDYLVTLDHQPCEYVENGKAGTDLLLSGHTHGGHFFPFNLIFRVIKTDDAVYGHTQIDNDTQAIVTSGFALWGFSAKTAAPSEYVIIDIKPN